MKDKNRLIFLGVALLLMGYIGIVSPDIKFPLMIHKLSLVTVAAIVGYFVDVLLFPNFRPKDWKDKAQRFETLVASMMIRRSLIILSLVLGVSMGV